MVRQICLGTMVEGHAQVRMLMARLATMHAMDEGQRYSSRFHTCRIVHSLTLRSQLLPSGVSNVRRFYLVVKSLFPITTTQRS